MAAGPFRGLRLVAEPMWNGLASYLCGSYESELHALLEELVAAAPTTVIDVGCADGFYAVGLALRLPAARIHAFDIDPRARAACEHNGEANGVRDRLTVHGLCTPAILDELLDSDTLLIVDCEGAELDLLAPSEAPRLASATILVELHDFVDGRITPTILGRFSTTHAARLVSAVPPDPSRWSALSGLSPEDRTLAIDERRPSHPHPMQWAVLVPLDGHGLGQ